ACAFAGWGEEVQLGPPHVPFARRGAYRRREPVVDEAVVLAALNEAGISSSAPEQRVNVAIVCNQMAWATYNRPLGDLSEPQQERLRLQADAVAEAAGWRVTTEEGSRQSTTYYARPLAPNLHGARQALAALLADYGGYPVRADTVQAHAERGAYGRSFYGDDLDPALVGLVRQLLAEHGYEAEPDEREYRPRPASVPEDAAVRLQETLAALEPVQTEFGPGLLRDVVLETARAALDLPQLGDWQAEQLLAGGPLGEALSRLGYRREATWCQPYHFRPPLEEEAGSRKARQVLLREIRITRDTERRLSLASGLPVYTPAVVLDPDSDDVVYLQMVGPKQAVRANWAALAVGRVQWIGRQRVELDGMKHHALVQTALPCGWLDAVLIHKQASLQAMNPEEPFYLLDGGDGRIPPLFYPMLNRCLAIPLLETWGDYLWARGREEQLITLLSDGAGQGYAAWRVLPAPEMWQQVVQEGLASQTIPF
ncbi:MAG: hypothetical protein GX579_09305, partial [Chloroflexi bacterium]|nr:hypothetical protein [Chloroflexota bacterium]